MTKGVASGVRAHRPAVAELVEASAGGDVLVVCRLDRQTAGASLGGGRRF